MVPQKVLWRAFKAFIKPFEPPQRSVKIITYVNFLFVRDPEGMFTWPELEKKEPALFDPSRVIFNPNGIYHIGETSYR